MSVRLNKVLTELNIGLQTAIDYLKNKKSLGDIKDDANVNTKISDEQYDALVKEFKGDKDVKTQAGMIFPKKKEKEKEKPKAKPEPEKLEIYKESTMLSRLHDILHAGQPVKEEQPVVEERTMIEFEPERKQYETKQDVLERVRELAHGDEVPQKEEVDNLKTAFYKLHIAEREAHFKAFIDGGGDPNQYQIVPDSVEEAFKAEMGIIKEKRAKLFKEQEAEKQENLTKKLAIIDKIKSMITTPEEANKSYQEFKTLQQQWCEIKKVPAEREYELWRSYQLYCEQFYNLLQTFYKRNGDERRLSVIKQLQDLDHEYEMLDVDYNYYESEDDLNEIFKEYDDELLEFENDDNKLEDNYEHENDKKNKIDDNTPNEDEDNSDNNLGFMDTLDMNNRQENIDNVKANIKSENINSIIMDKMDNARMKDIVTNIYQSLQVYPGQFRDYSEFQNRIMTFFQYLGYNTIKPEELKEAIVELFPSVKFLEKFHRDADEDNPQYDLELAFRINSLNNVARVEITKSEPQNTQQSSVINKSVPSSETLSQIIKLLDTIPINPNNIGYVDLAQTGPVFKSNGIDIKLYAKNTADFFQKYLSDIYDLKKGSPKTKEPPYSFRKKKESYKPIHQTISRIDLDSNKKEIKETEKACLTKDLLKRVYNSIDEEGEWGYKNFNVFRRLINEKLGTDFSEAELKNYLKKECKGVKYYKNYKTNNGIINAFRADSLKWKAIDELMAFAIFPLIKKNGKNAFQQAIDQLADKALSEKWYYGTGEKSSNPILFNYFLLTFQRLKAEDREHRDDINWKTKIRESSNGDKALFNTGLVDSLYDPIYALFNRNKNSKNERKWMFSKFIGGRDKEMQTLTRDFGTDLPLPAHYYNDTSELVYNIKSKIGSYNWDHFIDHCERLPLDFLEGIVRSFEGDFDFSQKRNSTFYRNLAEYIKGNDEILRGIKNRIENAIKDAIKRVHWNFKTAIPIYYPGQKQISLLLPLSLKRKDRIDVALVLEAVENGAYIAHTILTLQMAYTNARLITRPDSDWLTAESIDDNDNMIEDIED